MRNASSHGHLLRRVHLLCRCAVACLLGGCARGPATVPPGASSLALVHNRTGAAADFALGGVVANVPPGGMATLPFASDGAAGPLVVTTDREILTFPPPLGPGPAHRRVEREVWWDADFRGRVPPDGFVVRVFQLEPDGRLLALPPGTRPPVEPPPPQPRGFPRRPEKFRKLPAP